MNCTSGHGWKAAAWMFVPLAGLLILSPPAQAKDDGEHGTLYSLLNDQVLLIATVVGAIAALPPLIEFLIDRHKRKERIALSLEDDAVSSLNPQLAGMDGLLSDIADLIDRARNPRLYADLKLGNEILIIGTSLAGKKTFARRLAREAGFDRLITVFNPRNADALTKAKTTLQSYRRQKIMLLLPRIDSAFEKEDEELHNELEALIATTTELENVLVVGTAVKLEPDGKLDNVFGIKLVLPGTPQRQAPPRLVNQEARQVLAEVARFYLQQAAKAGFVLEGMTAEQFYDRLLQTVANPAEIQDIVVLCQTSALFRRHRQAAPQLSITPEILDRAIGRVIVSA